MCEPKVNLRYCRDCVNLLSYEHSMMLSVKATKKRKTIPNGADEDMSTYL